MIRFTEKSHSKSPSPPETNFHKYRKYTVLAAISVFCAILTAVLGTGLSFGWFAGGTDSTGVYIDSNGIKTEVELYYNENSDLLEIPDDNTYILQTRNSTRYVNGDTSFGIGHTLIYKVTVKNCSDEYPHSAMQDPDNEGMTADVKLSIPELNKYFDDAIAAYGTGNPVNLSGYAGRILMKLSSIKYRVDDGALQTYALNLTEEQSMIYNFGDGTPFFTFGGLEPQNVLTVFFMFECIAPYQASIYYRTYINNEYSDAVYNDYRTTIDSIVDDELGLMVIEKDNQGGGQGTVVLPMFTIPYFRVSLVEHIEP